MIYDTIANKGTYRELGPRFEAALDFLSRFDPATADGKILIDGENLYALVQSYTTASAATKPFESHRNYADVQFVVIGEEIICTAPLDRLTVTKPYAAEHDVILYSGPDDTPLRLRAMDFCILWPQDGHKPCCAWHAPGRVKKVVIKVRL